MTQQPSIRRYEGGIPPRGWAVVNVPGEAALEVKEPLATEIANLVARGRVDSARALLFWFDTENAVQGEDPAGEPPPADEPESPETSFVREVRKAVKARADLIKVVAEQASLAAMHAENAATFARHTVRDGSTSEAIHTALEVSMRFLVRAKALLDSVEKGKR